MRQCWNRQTGTFEGRVRERTGSSPVCRIKTLEDAIRASPGFLFFIVIICITKNSQGPKNLRVFCSAGSGGRTRTVSLPLDFESSTSANSIIPAYLHFFLFSDNVAYYSRDF